MLERDLELAYGDYVATYQQVVCEATASFEEKVGVLTVFHKIIIDRVADAYVSGLKAQSPSQTGENLKKLRTVAAELQRWLRIATDETRVAQSLEQAKRKFYDKVADVLEDTIGDDGLRREVLRGIKRCMEE